MNAGSEKDTSDLDCGQDDQNSKSKGMNVRHVCIEFADRNSSSAKQYSVSIGATFSF